MTEEPGAAGWRPWPMVAALFPQLQDKGCSVSTCTGDPVAVVKRRIRRANGYHLYWQPYCKHHAEQRGIDVVEGRVRYAAGFSNSAQR